MRLSVSRVTFFIVLCRSLVSSAPGTESSIGLSEVTQARSRNRDTPTRPAVDQGFDTSKGPMNIS
ncbi:MAG: hypothetical protein FD137_2111 [Spirochaetes bacterium]|nr:MAG: hypothetical protein FD137_2111 [Spirochaetota bacterium]